MSGFHIPRWLDLILTAGDKVHKAVHPSRWGEGKPCECGKLTRGDCGGKERRMTWRERAMWFCFKVLPDRV